MKKAKKNPRKTSGSIFNYLAWIANLGVVPLFLFAAFLFVPALFFLAALLFFVTLVLETISKLLSIENIIKICQIKALVLPIFDLSVKGFMLSLLFNPINAMELQHEALSSYSLSIGEVKQISIPKISKYSISNKDILKIKYDPEKNQLTLKAQKLGSSTLTLFQKKSNEQNINEIKIEVFVINKIQEAKILETTSLLTSWGFTPQIIGKSIYLSGEVNNKNDFYRLKKLEQESLSLKLTNLKISKELRAEIIADIYTNLFKYNLTEVTCSFEQQLGIICLYPDSIKINNELVKNIKENYGVTFQEINSQKDKNYKIKMKIIQVEKLDGKEFNLGLDKIIGNVSEVVHGNIGSIIEKNEILLNNHHLDLSTLAEPNINFTLNSPYQLQIGSDISYKSYDKDRNTTTTDWKFAGLKIKLLLENQNSNFLLTYTTEVSKPEADLQSINSNQIQGTIKLKKDTPLVLAEVELKTTVQNESSFPGLGSIPVLNLLFKSKSNSSNFKKLVLVMELTNE